MVVYLRTTFTDPRVLEMTTEDAELLYAFYKDAEDEYFYRLERILGTTWTASDVFQMSGGEEEGDPKKVSRNEKVKYPLLLGLNPAIMKDLKSRFGGGTGPMNFEHDDGIHGAESMFHMSKDEYMQRIGAKGKKDQSKEEEADEYAFVKRQPLTKKRR